MTITIFGATGTVGKQLVQQALLKGYKVKAYGRNVYTELPMEEENLTLIKGGLFDEKDVAKAIEDSDAVLSAIGGDMDGDDKTRSLGMKNIVTQMQKVGVGRIIAVGGIGLLQADENTLIMDTEDFPTEFIPVSLEHKKAFDYLQASTLKWTFVCPPMIKDAAPVGKFLTAINMLPTPNKFNIGSGDLALYMLHALETTEHINQRIGISTV